MKKRTQKADRRARSTLLVFDSREQKLQVVKAAVKARQSTTQWILSTIEARLGK